MRIRTLVYYITTGFVVGIIMLLLAQYFTSNNIRELISGNENLLNEYKLSNELVRLQKDLLVLDNKTKLAVTTRDSTRVSDFERGIDKIREDVRVLEDAGNGDTSSTYMNDLRLLIGAKIDFSRQLVDSFYHASAPATENTIAETKAIKLSEQITGLIHKIDTSGRIALAQKVKLVDQEGKRVLNWNLYITVLVLFLLTAVFLIIINRMKKQSELIGQLNTSERKLKEAALIKENFLANMSHEIRTPLNAILGYTHLLQKKKLDEDVQLHVTTVQQSGETLLSIVNDILDLSKIESGMMRIEEVPFCPDDLIRSAAAMFHQKMEEKGLLLKLSLSPDLPLAVAGDSMRLTQILVNLLGNAVKFTPKGEIGIDVQSRNIDSDHVELEFKIADSGIGIEKEKLETIFERFRQAEDSTTRKYGGTGLGLSIVRDLVHLQNGSIEVKSKPGSGTIVLVTIPYKVLKQQESVHLSETDRTMTFHGENRSVLVVEDNEINQGLMVHLLQNRGIHVRIAGNGKLALELLRDAHFDLIFMDIQMPEMDGYTATREIRQSLGLTTPIVAMTAHAMAGERDKCIRLGMNDHISKPIRETELTRIFTTFWGEPFLETQSVSAPAEEGFRTIHLRYMREISNGDVEYEKLVTKQFLDLIPVEITALEIAMSAKNEAGIARIAHSLKTSVSIMGLDQLLADDLDALENGNLHEDAMHEKLSHVVSVCRSALLEAERLYSRFDPR